MLSKLQSQSLDYLNQFSSMFDALETPISHLHLPIHLTPANNPLLLVSNTDTKNRQYEHGTKRQHHLNSIDRSLGVNVGT
jgi:hypothetical protein